MSAWSRLPSLRSCGDIAASAALHGAFAVLGRLQLFRARPHRRLFLRREPFLLIGAEEGLLCCRAHPAPFVRSTTCAKRSSRPSTCCGNLADLLPMTSSGGSATPVVRNRAALPSCAASGVIPEHWRRRHPSVRKLSSRSAHRYHPPSQDRPACVAAARCRRCTSGGSVPYRSRCDAVSRRCNRPAGARERGCREVESALGEGWDGTLHDPAARRWSLSRARRDPRSGTRGAGLKQRSPTQERMHSLNWDGRSCEQSGATATPPRRRGRYGTGRAKTRDHPALSHYQSRWRTSRHSAWRSRRSSPAGSSLTCSTRGTEPSGSSET